jgi:hypothetical protein
MNIFFSKQIKKKYPLEEQIFLSCFWLHNSQL